MKLADELIISIDTTSLLILSSSFWLILFRCDKCDPLKPSLRPGAAMNSHIFRDWEDADEAGIASVKFSAWPLTC